jgi:hypothetical protein
MVQRIPADVSIRSVGPTCPPAVVGPTGALPAAGLVQHCRHMHTSVWVSTPTITITSPSTRILSTNRQGIDPASETTDNTGMRHQPKLLIRSRRQPRGRR